VVDVGYHLSSEEHPAPDLVGYARRAEEAGFSYAVISDHFHPWTHRQGQAPFVWAVLGAIAQATKRLRVGTAVTAPIRRTPPYLVAHAAASVATLLPGRFFLGVGTGENLNEHVTGAKWPAPDERLEMLEEAVEVMRLLWQGDYQTHRGKHYTVENLRIFDLPDEPIQIAVAAMQPQAAELAGRIGDSLVNVMPKPNIVKKFEESGGKDKPRYGKVTACWAPSKEAAKKTAIDAWPNALVEGSASQELPLPKDFELLVEGRDADELEGRLVLGNDPDEYVEQLEWYGNAGYTHVYVHQIGPDQDGFLKFAKSELFGRL
jgi:coenzyme F420-dependent glucose-6-phosphate dehydrogenase